MRSDGWRQKEVEVTGTGDEERRRRCQGEGPTCRGDEDVGISGGGQQ